MIDKKLKLLLRKREELHKSELQKCDISEPSSTRGLAIQPADWLHGIGEHPFITFPLLIVFFDWIQR